MPRKKFAFILLLLLSFSFITGCWSRKEIETLAFVTVIGVDKDGDNTIVTCQIALPQGGEDGGGASAESPVWTVTGRGKTIAQAVFNLTRYVGKQIFLSHVQVIIIGEEQAKAGLDEITDFFNRTPQFRGTHWLAIAKGKASEIMKVEPKLNTMPAFYLDELFLNARENSIAPAVTWLQFTRQTVSPAGCQGYAPVLHKMNAELGTKEEFTEDKIEEGENGASGSSGGGGENKAPGEALSLEQTAVIKNNKLVGWLTTDETRGLLWIRGEVDRGILTLENSNLGEGKITTFPTFSRSKIVVKPKGETVEVDVFISQEGNLSEHTVDKPIANPNSLKILNKELSAKIKAQAEAALFKLQKQLKADITGISYQVRAQQPEIAEKIKWEEEFPKVKINVYVDASIRRTGSNLWPTYIERSWEGTANYQDLPLNPNFE